MTRSLLIRLAAVVVLLGVLLLAGLLVLTQTQAGRGVLLGQIEAAFDRQFEGSLELGPLRGGYFSLLEAEGAVLRDPRGEPVLTAEAVAFRPGWRALLRGDVVLRHVTLTRPDLRLVWQEDGSTNLADALRPRRPTSDQPADAPLLDLAGVRVIDGAVTTASTAPPLGIVQAGWLFDVQNARLTGLHALVSLRADGDATRLTVRRFRAALPDLPATIEGLEGRLTFTGDGLHAENVRLALTDSRLEGELRTTPEGLAVHLAEARLDGAEIARLVPAFPLRDRLAVEGRIEGALDDLRLERLRLERGASAAMATGRLRHLPDSLAFDLTLDPLLVRPEDVRALLPEFDGLDRLGRIDGRAEAVGSLAWTGGLRTATDARIALSTEGGRLDGLLAVASAPGSALRLGFDGTVRDLDPGRLAADRALAGDLSGSVRFALSGPNRIDLDARLGAGAFAGRTFEALTTDLALRGRAVSGAATLTAGGRLALDGTLDLASGTADVTAEAVAFDARRLLPDSPPTQLTGTIRLDATGAPGFPLDALTADLALALDGSTVTLADSAWALPAEPMRLALRPDGAAAPRLTFRTEAVALDAEGDFSWDALVPLAAAWGERLAVLGRAEVDKPLRPDTVRAAAAPLPIPALAEQRITLKLTALRESGLRPLLPAVAEASGLALTATLSGERLALALDAQGGFVETGGPRLDGLDLALRLDALAEGDLFDGLDLRLDTRADSLSGFGAGTIAPRLTLTRLDGRRALALDVRAERVADSLALHLDGLVALEPTRNRLITDLAFESPGEGWRLDEGVIDLHPDALVFQAFEARRVRTTNGAGNGGANGYANGYVGGYANGATPVLSLRGIASARPEDVVDLRSNGVGLGELLLLAGLPLPFDGPLRADLAIGAALGQPVVSGEATVAPFVAWGTEAGRIHAASTIRPDSDAIALTLRAEPLSDSAAVRNAFTLGGDVRFPGRRPDGTRDAGRLDLAADIDRLDLFFFDHLFPALIAGSTGGASGSGTITGDFAFPLFNANLVTENGRTTVPDFNLELGVSGPVTVGREGIRLRDLHLMDKRGGTGRVGGLIGFNEYRFFSFDLAAALSTFEIIDVDARQAGTLPFYGRIRASGSATFTGPLDNVRLATSDAVTTPDSEIFIPITAGGPAGDTGFLVFANPDGTIPEPEARRSLVGQRPDTERPFLDGFEMQLGITAPPGSTVHLVFDPVIGDVISAVGAAEMQIVLAEGEFLTFGTFDVARGDYLFTAGDVFTRRFELAPGGTLTWDGDPVDAQLDLPATYRTRASLAGLDGLDARQRVPLVIDLGVTGRVSAPLVDLSIRLDESGGRTVPFAEALRVRLNEPDRQAEYATSVLLTNTFLLAPSDAGAAAFTRAADDLLFTSLSELVSTRLNRFLNQALDADFLDVAVGVQQSGTRDELDVTYGVALRLLDERLLIRGEGLYQQFESAPGADALRGEVAVEVRLGPSVSLEAFYRREGDPTLGAGLSAATVEAYGAGVTYRTEFTSWNAFMRRLLGPESAAGDSVTARTD